MPATVASFQDHFISRPLRVLAPPTAEPPGASVVSRSAPYSLPLGDSRASYESQAVEGCEPIVTDRRGTLWAAILGSGIVFLDSSVLTVALPRIARDLPAHVVGTLEGESYVYNGYLLGESAFLILAGWLTDVHGRRRIFTLGLTAFGASSLLSGLAPSLEWLIVLRLLQGISGALIVPGSLALVTASFSGEEQGRAFGVWSGASAGVAVLGPMLGGLLVDALSWRAVFLINVPLVLVALWLTRRYVGEGRAAAPSGSLDLPGTVLTALALAGLSVGAISGQQRGCSGVHTATRLRDRSTSWSPGVWSRRHPHGRSAYGHGHGVRSGRACRRGLSRQHRDFRCGPSAGRGGAVRRDDAEFLRCAGARCAQPGCRLRRGTKGGCAAQCARSRVDRGGPTGGPRGIHGRLPPGHGRGCFPAARGSRHQRRGVALTLRRARGAGCVG